MDLELSPEQEEMARALRQRLGQAFGPEARRSAAGLPGALDRGLWAALADAGTFCLRLPESEGGAGLGWVEAVVAFEELGRAAVPGPLAATFLAAGLVEGADAGRVAVGACGPLAPGQPGLVEHLEALDHLLVADPSGSLVRLDPARLSARPLPRPLDPLTPVHLVEGPLPSGEELAGPPAGETFWRQGALLCAALQVGLGAAAVEMAVGHAKSRVQFGRVIGSFQAVKHQLAEAWVALEVARSAVWAAAATLDEDGPGQDRALAGARLVASRAARVATRTCVHVHGGLGYTWELDAHLYLKRAQALDWQFWPPHAAADALEAGLGRA
ncbi:MAG TPA: acyl-CoA dehydrogenase family protein [Acidimicrobiales bacterium]|nr:acyl-CoA dehydrogenase family protein [Acidimicrobiales bacterium]